MTGVIAGCSSEKSETNKVNIDKVEIVAPNVQGAGWDLTARAMQNTNKRKIFTKPITVTNKVGGAVMSDGNIRNKKAVTYWRLTQAYS